jgi:chromosome segregation ATPase
MTPEERADAIVDGILYEGWHGPRARESIAAAIRAEGEHWKETYNITVNNMANEQDALRAENAKLRAENGLLMAENRTESERLKEACDGYLGHAAGLRDENAKLLERIRFADQEFAAECAGLRGEIERLTDTGSRFAQANAALQDANEDLRSEVHELRAENERLKRAVEQNYSIKNLEIKRLREALGHIAFASGDQPAAMNMPEADWYRSRFYDCVATASAALQSKGE